MNRSILEHYLAGNQIVMSISDFTSGIRKVLNLPIDNISTVEMLHAYRSTPIFYHNYILMMYNVSICTGKPTCDPLEDLERYIN